MTVTGCRIILGDSSNAAEIAPDLVGKVSLVVTSPPYHNAISYTSHADDPGADYRIRDTVSYSGEYLPMLGRVWSSCYSMLRPGGYLAINVGTVLLDGYQFPLPQDLILHLDESDDEWEFIRSIIWNKVTAGVKRAGSVIKHRLPGYWYPNILTEQIIVVRKHGETIPISEDVPEEWWLPTWDIAPVPPRKIPHPAPFPEDLPHRLIRMLTNKGDIVMDPFLGAGSTSKAAYDLGRVPLGFDIEPTYITYAQERLNLESSVRHSQLRIQTVPAKNFTPSKSKGQTRHGAGLKTRINK